MNDIKGFLGRGALAGAAGGLAAALFQWIVTEDQVNIALAIEAANSEPGGDEMFSRGTQVVGGMAAAGIYGICIGIVFAMACAALWRGLSGRTVFERSIRLAVVGYGVWVLVPSLKYPANPPAVGDPDTVGQRTAAYLALMVVSIVLAYLAWELWQRLSARGMIGAPRFAAVAGSYFAAITVTYVLFPANPDSLGVPANLIWHFRIDSLAENALMWLVMGTVFGWLGDRRVARSTSPSAAERDSLSV